MLEFLTTHLPEKFFLDTSAFIKNRKGFTLVELVVVIAILGILAGLAIPRFMDATASARGARIVADMRTIDSAIMMYNAKTGNLPANIAAITTTLLMVSIKCWLHGLHLLLVEQLLRLLMEQKKSLQLSLATIINIL